MIEVPYYQLDIDADIVVPAVARALRARVAAAPHLDVAPPPARWPAWLLEDPCGVALRLLQTVPSSEVLDRAIDKAATHFCREQRPLHLGEVRTVMVRNMFFIHDYPAMCRRRRVPEDRQHYYELLVFLLWPAVALVYLDEVAEPDGYTLVAGDEPVRRTG